MGFVIMKALYLSEIYEFNAALNVALHLIVLLLLVEKRQASTFSFISLSHKT